MAHSPAPPGPGPTPVGPPPRELWGWLTSGGRDRGRGRVQGWLRRLARTFGSAQGVQQDVVLVHFLPVVLELPPQLGQLLAGELPRALRLEERAL